MSLTLIPTASKLPAEIVDVAAGYAAQAASPATARAYTSDWTAFAAWCSQHGLATLPALPTTISGFLAMQAAGGMSVATVERRLAAISMAHRQADHGCDTRHPAISAVMAGIRRQHGVKQQQVAAAVADDVRAMVARWRL